MASRNRRKREVRSFSPPAGCRSFPLQRTYFSAAAVWSLWVLGALCALTVFLPFFPLPTMLGVLAFGITLLVTLRRRRPRLVVVGADGVLVHDQFISHSEIQRVRHQWRVRHESDEHTGLLYEMDEWALSLELVGGDALVVETKVYPRKDGSGDRPVTSDDSGAEMARAIEEAHEKWASRGALEDLLARRQHSGSDWLRTLRRLGSGAVGAYRGGAVDLEQLSRTLRDACARPSHRAAVAIVLGASGDTTAPRRLRLAVESVADPRLRVALTDIAEGENDTAIAEALEALDEIDHVKGRR